MKNTFPPEWAPQYAILLTWPHRHSDWRSRLHAIEETYGQIAKHISDRETLIIIAYDEAHATHINDYITPHCNMDHIQLVIIPTNDTWIRDYGPISTINNGKIHWHDFRFNAWGGKFQYEQDNAVTRQLIQHFSNPPYQLSSYDFICEGGNLETDGHGTLLTNRACLCHPNRNPNLSEAEIKALLQDTLHIKKFLWLDHGDLLGDDTDSHIDILARFCDPHTICYTAPAGPHDPNYATLTAMAEQLKTFTDYTDQPYTLIPLPCPQPIVTETGQHLPANYSNFLIINGAVLLPVFDDPADQIAIQRLSACFPDREIIPIPARTLTEQGGALHCATMNIALN